MNVIYFFTPAEISAVFFRVSPLVGRQGGGAHEGKCWLANEFGTLTLAKSIKSLSAGFIWVSIKSKLFINMALFTFCEQ